MKVWTCGFSSGESGFVIRQLFILQFPLTSSNYVRDDLNPDGEMEDPDAVLYIIPLIKYWFKCFSRVLDQNCIHIAVIDQSESSIQQSLVIDNDI